MNKYIGTLLFLLLMHSGICHAQTETKDSTRNGEDTSVKTYVEVMPHCPYDLAKYLSKNLKYPNKDNEQGIEGRVIAKFVVNEDGSISNVEITKRVSPGIDAEALRVVSHMPDWEPGMQNGKKVKVFFMLPLSFKLEERKRKK